MKLGKLLLLTSLVALISGCVTMSNRVACTLSNDKAVVLIEAGVKIALDIDPQDAEVACSGMVLNQVMKVQKK